MHLAARYGKVPLSVSLAPAILIMMTSFVRMVVVLSLLRTAMGLQQSPPNAVLISLSLFLTAIVMGPTMFDRDASALDDCVSV